MGSILSSIGSFAKAAAPIASVGSTVYNLYNAYENQQYQNLLRSYAQNPAKMNAYAQQFTQPLNAGLTTSVANQAQAYLADRGLSDSPQIAQQVEAQAIAPQIQQNQQQGYQNALQALNLGGGAINPYLQQQNTFSALTKGLASLQGLQGLNPAVFSGLMQSGAVQPVALDPGLSEPSALPAFDPSVFNINTPIDTSGLEPSLSDLSSWWTPDYSVSGG